MTLMVRSRPLFRLLSLVQVKMPNPVATEVGTFEKGKLKHVDPEEKNVLPTADGLPLSI